VSVAAITICVASQRIFIVVYFVTESVRKILETLSYNGGIYDPSQTSEIHVLPTYIHHC
jgi:hypothetical protein